MNTVSWNEVKDQMTQDGTNDENIPTANILNVRYSEYIGLENL